MNSKAVTASVATFGDETKLRFFIEGEEFAIICKSEDLPKLRHERGEEIRKVTF